MSPPPVQPPAPLRAEGALPGDAGDAVIAPVPEPLSPLALLITGHLIPEGETVVLLLKPSMFYIPLTSMFVLGFAALIGVSGTVFANYLPGHPSNYLNAAVLLASARLMWACLQWMGRYYILTDLRVMTLSGVFNTQVVQCPLRKVARVRILRTFRERLLTLGTIEIIPQDESTPIGLWETVSSPRRLKERLQQAVARSKSGHRGV